MNFIPINIGDLGWLIVGGGIFTEWKKMEGSRSTALRVWFLSLGVGMSLECHYPHHARKNVTALRKIKCIKQYLDWLMRAISC
jgi:hypothetical protein